MKASEPTTAGSSLASMPIAYRFGYHFFRSLFRYYFGYHASGKGNVPGDGPVILAANHASYIDPPLVGAGVPLIMRRVGIDPAQSSAIVLIMITDALSFTTLLSLSWLLLGTAA